MCARPLRVTTLTVFLVMICSRLLFADYVDPISTPEISLTNPSNRHNLSSGASMSNPVKAMPANNGGTDQICIFCHTPHSASNSGALWNRPDPNGPSSGFELYAQPLAIKGDTIPPPDGTGLAPLAGAQSRSQYSTDSGINPDGYPNGASRLCLSCHDGATAVGILNDGTSIAMAGGIDYLSGNSVIDLSTSHPVSFVYDDAVYADVIRVRGVGTYKLPAPEVGGVDADGVDTPLDNKQRMQCTTCHDPHYDSSLADGSLPPFWRQTNSSTAYEDVCNACHDAPPVVRAVIHRP